MPMVISEVSITPIGKGTSVGKYIKKVIELFRRRKLKMFHSPMGTCIEAPLDEIFSAINEVHEVLAKSGVKRISTLIKIDDRRDKKTRMEDKLRAII